MLQPSCKQRSNFKASKPASCGTTPRQPTRIIELYTLAVGGGFAQVARASSPTITTTFGHRVPSHGCSNQGVQLHFNAQLQLVLNRVGSIFQLLVTVVKGWSASYYRYIIDGELIQSPGHCGSQVTWLRNSFRPEGLNEEIAMGTLRRLGHGGLGLNEYEKRIASRIIHPDDIKIRLADIGGLEDIISSLRESVIISLLRHGLFRSPSALLTAPKGILLHGPPGCGKTMLAKALAKESGATFINITPSALTNKWFGESNQLVAGLFSLARKMQPSIIFIDEIDSLLRERSEHDHEVTAMMKAEFMTLWDGLLSGSDRITILGATNRIEDIDPAFLRRMPKQFLLTLPDAAQREKILTLLLRDVPLAPRFPMWVLVEHSRGMSGSDLKELCRNAATSPIRELVRQNGGVDLLARSQGEGLELRPLNIKDFIDSGGSSTVVHAQSDIPGPIRPLVSTQSITTQSRGITGSRARAWVSSMCQWVTMGMSPLRGLGTFGILGSFLTVRLAHHYFPAFTSFLYRCLVRIISSLPSEVYLLLTFLSFFIFRGSIPFL
ncbi:P-loop containing nucleoside triphosphate hydrolase protein [Lactarius hengduanensis]|nr:P-loop containing nucleoside triphosphate hydrolase protein [Lactarius hengduanensis]